MAEFEIVRDAAQSRVSLGEKLTAAQLPAIQIALKQEIDAGIRAIVFDFARMVTLDSSGIGLLIATGNSLAAVQGTIRLENVSSDIFKLLRSMRLVDRLHASVDSAGAIHG
jgi:serine/threonine-protein kinase RsbW